MDDQEKLSFSEILKAACWDPIGISSALVGDFLDWIKYPIHGIKLAIEGNAVNASMGAAHDEYGEEFEAAYDKLASMDGNDPFARRLVQGIWADPDPGQALMKWYRRVEAA